MYAAKGKLMAFNDAKRYSDKLRIKNGIDMSAHADPKARRDQCWSPWCDIFVEDMGKNNRCNTDACNKRLYQEALSRGSMFRIQGTLFGNVESLLVNPESIQPSARTYEILHKRGLNHDPIPMCSCGKNIPAPGSKLCIKCKHAQKLSDHYNRQRNKHRGGQTRGSTGMNKIKGLGALCNIKS